MNPIKVMVNGIPGDMAKTVARHVLADQRFELLAFSLTGPEIQESEYRTDSMAVRLIPPNRREASMVDIRKSQHDFLCVDFTHPSAVNANAECYCTFDIPFVMGTTGGDRKRLADTVASASISAVIAPNMAKQIVGFQAMMEYAATTFPGLFKGYTLEIRESHQKAKADTSGTARAMTTYFQKLGIPVSVDDIIKERDPEIQKSQLKIPQEYLGGHGWHTYTLVSDDRTVRFQFTHNVNGRDIYAKGTLDALIYLQKKVKAGIKAQVYTMIDVLAGN